MPSANCLRPCFRAWRRRQTRRGDASRVTRSWLRCRQLQTDHDAKVKLSLPPHVAEVLTGWAVFELQKTPEEVLEALAEELVGNEQLRAFAAGLVTD